MHAGGGDISQNYQQSCFVEWTGILTGKILFLDCLVAC